MYDVTYFLDFPNQSFFQMKGGEIKKPAEFFRLTHFGWLLCGYILVRYNSQMFIFVGW